MKQVALILLLLLLPQASARDGDIWQQLPARHAIMRIFKGDINQDGRTDAIVLLRSWDEAANPDTPRPLLIFLGNAQGRLIRVARANLVVRCAACGGVAGDPWARKEYPASIILEDNGFSILEFAGSGWRGWRRVSFRFQNSRFWLVRCQWKTWHVDHIFAPEVVQTKPRVVAIEAFESC